jgi:hypothetical protein
LEKEQILAHISEFFADGNGGKIAAAVVGAVLAAMYNSYKKRSRLRAAVSYEVEITSRIYAEYFTEETRAALEEKIKTIPGYMVVILTSKSSLIGNLNDDISYFKPEKAKAILEFLDIIGLVDDAIQFMKTAEFTTLSELRKLSVLAIPFDKRKRVLELACKIRSGD